MKHLYLLVIAIIFISCQKDVLPTLPDIEDDRFYLPTYSQTKRPFSTDLLEAAKGKPVKQNGSIRPANCILLDFNGAVIPSGSWFSSPTEVAYSGMSSTEIDAVIAKMIKAFEGYNVVLTTDEAFYNTYTTDKRLRIVFTETWEWYGQAAGVAYMNSFGQGESVPAFVFTSLMGYNSNNIASVGVHEGGHTLGLRHIGEWSDGVLISEYSKEGYWMGQTYHLPSGYFGGDGVHAMGTNVYGSQQNDHQIITNRLY